MSAWDDLQQTARERLWSAIDAKHKSIVAVAPTGFGKTNLAQMLIRDAVARGLKWEFLTHRKTLLSQTIGRFDQEGIDFGVRASGWEDRLDVQHIGQVTMIQSEKVAVKETLRRSARALHEADLVLVDEAHCNKSGFAEELIRGHIARGASIVGLTATPVDLAHLYTHMEVLATNSQLRAAGGLVLAETYAPSEVDFGDVVKLPAVENQGAFYMEQQVVGDIYDHLFRLNPQLKPTLGFAPCVKSSIHMVDEATSRGIRAAHIDGEHIYLGERDWTGKQVLLPSEQKLRDDVFAKSKSGEIQLLWNRFVMREGVDLPWLAHGIFACAFSSPQGWIQACGRFLRSYPGLERIVIQDHGGNVFRPGLGSPNQDRQWSLDDTEKSLVDAAKEARKDGTDKPPVACPKCGKAAGGMQWKAAGGKCPSCRFTFNKATRKIHQTDGTLKVVPDKWWQKFDKEHSPGFNPMQKVWDNLYYPSKNSKSPRAQTFRQLMGQFESKNPGYLISERNGTPVVFQKETGRFWKLRNAPANLADWGQKANEAVLR